MSVALYMILVLAADGVSAEARRPEDDERAPHFEIEGYLRLRGDARHNFDLDRGLTPSGAAFYPLPLADARRQNLYTSDMRLRLDIQGSAQVLSQSGVAIKLRADVLDNAVLGATPATDTIVAATTGQRGATDAITVKRLYGEALTPVGLLAAGRMGNHWGLGILANGGDCDDCDHGDGVDRVALATPILGHLVSAAFDFSATGPVGAPTSGRSVDLEPTDDGRTVSVAAGRFRDDETRELRRERGQSTLEYGTYLSHRWQNSDVAGGSGAALDSSQVIARGFTATAADAWTRITWPRARLELEAAVLWSRIEQPSLVPGVLYDSSLSARQVGLALESEIALGDGLWVGLDCGYASGDGAPGMGASTPVGASYPQAGELDGPQARPPYDTTVNNFRFHPDYHVDRILFREILGSVTDAIYVRPRLGWQLVDTEAVRLRAELAVVAARAAVARSTPSGAAPLGVEADPALVYEAADGFRAVLEYAYFHPLSGLDNPATGQVARAAQRLDLRILFIL